jgi:hypothetical protein
VPQLRNPRKHQNPHRQPPHTHTTCEDPSCQVLALMSAALRSRRHTIHQGSPLLPLLPLLLPSLPPPVRTPSPPALPSCCCGLDVLKFFLQLFGSDVPYACIKAFGVARVSYGYGAHCVAQASTSFVDNGGPGGSWFQRRRTHSQCCQRCLLAGFGCES